MTARRGLVRERTTAKLAPQGGLMTTKRTVERVTRFTRRAGVYAVLAFTLALVSPSVQAQASI